MRKRRGAVMMVSLIVIAFLVWTLLPLVMPPGLPDYHAVDITIEELNVYRVRSTMFTGTDGFLPERVIQECGEADHYTYMYAGLGRISVGDESYTYVFAYFEVYVSEIVDRLLGKKLSESYLLGFFCNSSEVGELFKSYGFPYTYVKATYHLVTEKSMNHTYIRLDYPDGRPLIELSAMIPHELQGYDGKYMMGQYRLNSNNNLTVLDLTVNYAYVPVPSSASALNVTFTVGSEPWKYMRYRTYVDTVFRLYPARSFVGKIGWLDWKNRED